MTKARASRRSLAGRRSAAASGTYMERRGRHRLAVMRAMENAEFLSELAGGLAGVNLFEPGVPEKLVAAATKLDALG